MQSIKVINVHTCCKESHTTLCYIQNKCHCLAKHSMCTQTFNSLALKCREYQKHIFSLREGMKISIKKRKYRGSFTR